MITLSDSQLEAIKAHGVETFPHECCGVILGEIVGDKKVVQQLRKLENVHEDGHERRYLVSPDEMFQLLREERETGVKVLGFYHSHPNHPAIPSGYDRDWASPWYTYIIVSILDGKPDLLTAWVLDEDGAEFLPDEILTTESGA